MKEIQTYKELYNEILRMFYFGMYKKGDKFPNHMQLQEKYDLAVNTVKKVFIMLREDGFIMPEPLHGTIVLFDRDNPEHMKKLPYATDCSGLDRPNTQRITIDLLTKCIIQSFKDCSRDESKDYLLDINTILFSIDNNISFASPERSLLYKLCTNCRNKFLNVIARDIIENEMLFNKFDLLEKDNYVKLSKKAMEFYLKIKQRFQSRDFHNVEIDTWNYLQECYMIPEYVIYSVAQRQLDSLLNQTVNDKLTHSLRALIIWKNLGIGDMLPSTKEFCSTFGITASTLKGAREQLIKNEWVKVDSAYPNRLSISSKYFSNYREIEDQAKEEVELLDSLFLAAEIFAQVVLDSFLLLENPQSLASDINNYAWNRTQMKNWNSFEIMLKPLVDAIDCDTLKKYYLYLEDGISLAKSLYLNYGKAGSYKNEDIKKYMITSAERLEHDDFENFKMLAITSVQAQAQEISHAFSYAVRHWLKTTSEAVNM